MKHPNIRIARLKEMIALEEKRAALFNQIAVVNARLSAIQSELYGAGAGRQGTARKAQEAPVKLKPVGLRKRRGELRGQILEMLNAAGKEGVSVKEVADRIGVKAVNIHSWFGMNSKKMPGLKKVGKARYAITGTLVPQPAKKAKKAKAKKAPQKAKAVQAPKGRKAAKGGRQTKVVKPGRGE